MRFWICLALLLLAFAAGAWLIYSRHVTSSPPAYLQGMVLGDAGPIPGAKVRFQGDPHFVLSKPDASFELPGIADHQKRITAWKEAYFIAGTPSDADSLTLKLIPLPVKDNEEYAWVDPAPDPAHSQTCGNCHRQIYDEWLASGHARSATNRRFLNLYEGIDWLGRARVGWSLRDDHPDGIGVCNACHAPTVPFDADLRNLSGIDARGVHCDFCHKVSKVSSERIGFTHGRYGLELLRPSRGQIFFGPLDDVDRGEDTFASIYHESRYCASCHEGVVFGVPVYTTYSEWLDSPARKEGKQCQSCHMAPTGAMSNIAPGKGGIERDPHTLANHRFFKPSQPDMLRRSLNVLAEAIRRPQFIQVAVRVQADDVGHRVPTGFADRNLVLVLEAFGLDKSAILSIEGPKLPRLAGKALAGKAGRIYAKRLTDFDGHGPVPFWRARPEIEDNRLYPGQADSLEWQFPAQATRLQLRVIYRRFWTETAETKGWPRDDIVVLDQEVPIQVPNSK